MRVQACLVRHGVLLLTAGHISTIACANEGLPQDLVPAQALQSASATSLAPGLGVGDIVFIRVRARPFREVARATNSWTNHVGIVVDTG
ncbi:hypothetical protein CLD22_28325, partial [Rubrivivax gelatinosus]|nr:hypothetical protein [Rubrivivax gelatinosus]